MLELLLELGVELGVELDDDTASELELGAELELRTDEELLKLLELLELLEELLELLDRLDEDCAGMELELGVKLELETGREFSPRMQRTLSNSLLSRPPEWIYSTLLSIRLKLAKRLSELCVALHQLPSEPSVMKLNTSP